MMKTSGYALIALIATIGTTTLAETLDIVPGTIGSPADFDTGMQNLLVDGSGAAEVWVEFDPLGIAAGASTDPFTYTASFQWSVAAPGATLSLEGVSNSVDFFVNFADAGIDTSDSSSDTSISRGLTFPAFPFDVYGYHARIEGLSPGDTVVFQKIGMGGEVVPEPSTPLLVGFASVLLAFTVRRRR